MSIGSARKVFAVVTGLFLITGGVPPNLAQAAPPEGRGSEHAHEVANQGNGGGNADHGRGNSSHALQAALGRDPAHGNNSRQPGGSNFHASRPGDFGSGEGSVGRGTVGRGVEASSLKGLNRTIVEDFEKTLADLRKKEHSWTNHAPFAMLDPYGHSKDNRMELYGNRGRPIRAPLPPPEPVPPPVVVPPPPAPVPPPVVVPQYVTVTQQTYDILQLVQWNGADVTTSSLSSLGYTTQEINFLLALSLTDIQTALSGDGRILMP